jgi:hypothetical protein
MNQLGQRILIYIKLPAVMSKQGGNFNSGFCCRFGASATRQTD